MEAEGDAIAAASGTAEGREGIAAFLEKREEKTVIGGIDGFSVSADVKKALVVADRKLAILDSAPDQKLEKPLRTDEISAEIDPAAEFV